MTHTTIHRSLLRSSRTARRENLKAQGLPLPITKQDAGWTRRSFIKSVGRAGAASVASSALPHAAWALHVRIYAKSDANGDNNGTSWEDAYTSLQDALDAAAPHTRICTDAPRAAPFLGGYTVNADDWVLITDQGPSGETWLSNAHQAPWAGAGGGVWTTPLAAAPAEVVYDFKRDDVAGSVTGVDLTLRKSVEYLAAANIEQSYARAWYGFLRPNAATPTAPGQGEWGYAGGTLYINPSASPDRATVNALAAYCPDSVNAIFATGDRWRILGKLHGLLYPGEGSNAGYIVKGNGSNNWIQGVRGIACGYHCAGHSVASGANNRMSDILCVGHRATSSGPGAATPFVFFTPNNIPAGNYLGERLVFIGYPHLDTVGAPLTSLFRASCLLSHSVGVNTIGGVLWKNCYLLDFTAQLEAKHAITLVGSGQLCNAGSAPAFDPYNPQTYPVRVIDSAAWGRGATPRTAIHYANVEFDHTSADVLLNANAKPIQTWFGPGTKIYTEALRTGAFQALDAASLLTLEGATIVVTGGPDRGAVFQLSTDVKALRLFGGSTFEVADGVDANCLVVFSPTQWRNGLLGVVSEGAHQISTRFTKLLCHSNVAVRPRDAGWWIANIDGGATDTFFDQGV